MAETAVIRAGGRQFRVAVGDVLQVPRVEGAAGGEVTFDDVLLHEASGEVRIGSPTIAGARVYARVLAQGKDRKIRGFKYKPKNNYKRSFGHRQLITRVRITAIECGMPRTQSDPEDAVAEGAGSPEP